MVLLHEKTLETQAIKENISLTLSRQKHLWFKGHYQESEKTTHRMGENFVNHVSDKSLLCRIYKELL